MTAPSAWPRRHCGRPGRASRPGRSPRCSRTCRAGGAGDRRRRRGGGQPPARALPRELPRQDADRQCVLDAVRGNSRQAAVAAARRAGQRRGELVRDPAAARGDGARGGRDRGRRTASAPSRSRAVRASRRTSPRCARSRAAVGDRIHFYVDANSAYPRAEAADYVRVIAAEGARVAEDPCPLQPDRQFAELIGNSAIPVLVNSSCASLKDAAQYLERGAKALSVKPGRIGISEARRIADLAREKSVNVVLGHVRRERARHADQLAVLRRADGAAGPGRAELLPDDARPAPARAAGGQRWARPPAGRKRYGAAGRLGQGRAVRHQAVRGRPRCVSAWRIRHLTPLVESRTFTGWKSSCEQSVKPITTFPDPCDPEDTGVRGRLLRIASDCLAIGRGSNGEYGGNDTHSLDAGDRTARRSHLRQEEGPALERPAPRPRIVMPCVERGGCNRPFLFHSVVSRETSTLSNYDLDWMLQIHKHQKGS